MSGEQKLPAGARAGLLAARIFSASLIGLALMTWLAGAYLVDPGAGLAAAPEALSYGLAGAVIAGTLAAFAGRFLAPGHLRLLTGLTILSAAILAGVLTVRIFAALDEPGNDQHGLPPVTQARDAAEGPG